MVHTLQDYSTKYKLLRTYSNIDNNELAARLGSIDKFDRRGTVNYLDDMEHSLNSWHKVPTGIGSSITPSIDTYLTGEQSCKLVTGNLANETSYIQKWLPYSAISKTGIEVNVSLPDEVVVFSVNATYFTGTVYQRYIMTYDEDDEELQIATGGNNAETYKTSFTLPGQTYMFNIMKMVFDPTTGYYTRFIVNETEYDVSAYPGRTAGSGVTPLILLEITLQTKAAANKTCYVDNVIVTENE